MSKVKATCSAERLPSHVCFVYKGKHYNFRIMGQHLMSPITGELLPGKCHPMFYYTHIMQYKHIEPVKI